MPSHDTTTEDIQVGMSYPELAATPLGNGWVKVGKGFEPTYDHYDYSSLTTIGSYDLDVFDVRGDPITPTVSALTIKEGYKDLYATEGPVGFRFRNTGDRRYRFQIRYHQFIKEIELDPDEWVVVTPDELGGLPFTEGDHYVLSMVNVWARPVVDQSEVELREAELRAHAISLYAYQGHQDPEGMADYHLLIARSDARWRNAIHFKLANQIGQEVLRRYRKDQEETAEIVGEIMVMIRPSLESLLDSPVIRESLEKAGEDPDQKWLRDMLRDMPPDAPKV